ncbi:MAG TPA: isochorismatase family protein [Vicinamibacterales bacterium]|nr:isochorismatase family protein [Vicinamibacterales bacterium]
MPEPAKRLRAGDALMIVDVQRDFCAGGALAIERGDEVVPVLNRWIAAATSAGVPIYASRDWHPLRHPSFREFGGKWPPHCLQDSAGAQFHADLALPPSAIVVTKGVRFDRDQNSAFDGTGLVAELQRSGVTRLWVGGLAQDVCVCATVLDARREGFATIVLTDATMPVTREGARAAEEEMKRAGALFEMTG